MMRLVIVGEFDSDNVGDQLIGEGHIVLFSGRGCDVEVLPLEPRRMSIENDTRNAERAGLLRTLHRAFYQRSTMYRHSVESVVYLRRKDAYRKHAEKSLEGASALIVGGGQLLSDGTLRMVHRLDQMTNVARKQGIPIAIFGTGMSSGNSFLSRRLLRRVLSRVNSRSRFRDLASMEAARSTCSTLDITLAPTPDCAIAGIARRRMRGPGDGPIGIAPMSPRILSRAGIPVGEVDQWWIGIVQNLIREGATPMLFCTGVPDDMRYAAEIQEKLMRAGVAIDLLPRPESPDELLETLGGMKRILAQRLHASISFYALGGVPASASWDTKVVEFYNQISLPDRVFRIAEEDPETIVRLLMATGDGHVDLDVLVAESLSDAASCVDELLRTGKG